MILDSVLVYRLLNSADCSINKKQLIEATISKMDYQVIKDLNKNEIFKVGLSRLRKFLPNSPALFKKKYHCLFVSCLKLKINEF